MACEADLQNKKPPAMARGCLRILPRVKSTAPGETPTLALSRSSSRVLGHASLSHPGIATSTLDQLNDGELCRVTLTLAQLDDPGVPTGALLELGRNLVKQDVNQVVLLAPRLTKNLASSARRSPKQSPRLLPKAARSQPAKMNISLRRRTDGMPTQRDQLLNNLTNDLGLRDRRRDTPMLDDAGGKVGEHRVAVLAVPPKLCVALKVTHGMKGVRGCRQARAAARANPARTSSQGPSSRQPASP